MIGHWWLFGRKWRSLLQKRKLGPPNTEGPQEIWNIPRPWLQQTKKFSPPQKNYLWVGGVIIMKGDQKWEIVEVTIGIFFFVCFCLRFTIFYTGSFQVPHKKITPTYSASSHLKSQFDLSLSYMNVWKMAQSHPPPITQGGGGGCANYDLHLFCLFLPSQENHLDSQIIPYPKKKFQPMSLTKYDSLFPSEEN